MWQYRATVVRVVDGDTVDLTVDLGFRTFFTDRFRLYGIDTPERGQTGWSEAKQRLEQLLPVGSQMVAETYHPKERDERDGFGRWLATLYRSVNDATSINRQMVDEGFAVWANY